jgi:hypothetical protein
MQSQDRAGLQVLQLQILRMKSRNQLARIEKEQSFAVAVCFYDGAAADNQRPAPSIPHPSTDGTKVSRHHRAALV